MHHYAKQIYFVTISALFFIVGIYPTRAAAQNSFPTPTGIVTIADRDGAGCCAQLRLVVNDQETHFYEYGNGYESGKFQIHKYGSGSVGGPVFTILKTGYVGIGTTNPAHKLTVSGGWFAADNGYGLAVKDSGGTARTIIYLDSGNTIQVGNTSLTPNVVFNNSGNVGIGATSPQQGKLVISDTNQNSSRLTLSGQEFYAASNSSTDGVAFLLGVNRAGNKQLWIGDSSALTQNSTNAVFRTLVISGAVGIDAIGTDGLTPKILQVGNSAGVTMPGSLTVAGNINAKYQDVAEWVPSSEQLAAGTVVVLDSSKSNQVVASTTAYDTRVAGVISAQPGITLGEKTDDKVLVATTGRVRVMVDATNGPINIGDLLVTSDIPGVAMKSIPVEFAGRKMHMPGTIIGKALEPLAKGKGEILVLLSLQ